MARKLALACALFAALVATGAASAPPASAAAEFTAEAYPASLVGSQEEEFEFHFEGGLSAGCPIATYGGTFAAATSAISGIAVEFSPEPGQACIAFGLNNATIAMNECTFTFGDSVVVTANMKHRGDIDIVCPAGKKVTISTATCEVKIGTQMEIEPVTYEIQTTTPGSRERLVFKPEVANEISYRVERDGFLCPFAGTGNRFNGGFDGTSSAFGASASEEALRELGLTWAGLRSLFSRPAVTERAARRRKARTAPRSGGYL